MIKEFLHQFSLNFSIKIKHYVATKKEIHFFTELEIVHEIYSSEADQFSKFRNDSDQSIELVIAAQQIFAPEFQVLPETLGG